MNAKEAAFKSYKASMDKMKIRRGRTWASKISKIGTRLASGGYRRVQEYRDRGIETRNPEYQLALVMDIHALYDEIKAHVNKDPYKNIEFYLVPGLFAIVAYVLRISDLYVLHTEHARVRLRACDVSARIELFLARVHGRLFLLRYHLRLQGAASWRHFLALRLLVEPLRRRTKRKESD